jgi:tetratricopeptide (TPR) repeat protein
MWAGDLAKNPQSFDAAWKLARADYWLGGHAPDAERRAFFEQGIDAGRKAAMLEPKRPEGYFWMAANMGALAESFGLRQGIKYRKPIKDALETVLRLDAAFQQGSADRALGRWYFKVPRLFGGSRAKAEQHLRASLMYNPTSTASHFFLAEVLLDDGRTAEARAELQKVIDAPLDPEWIPEDREFKEKAKARLAQAPYL